MTALLLLASRLALAGLWQGLLVAAVVALSLRVLPQVTAAQRFVVWATAFVVALGLPFVELAGTPHGSAGVRVGQGWGAALAFLWVAMIAVRGTRLVVQGIRLHRIWRAARPFEVSPQIELSLQSCTRPAEVCASDDVDAPSVIGFWSPRLLVPAALLPELSEAELRQIVMHECEHLRRGDDWLNLAQKLAVAVFPLNLGLLWVDRRLGLERELACDAGVVAATGAPLEYASCLTRLAERRLTSRRLVLALSAWAQRSELARRVYTLLAPVHGLSRIGSRGALLGLACVLMVTADGVAHLPPLVSFAQNQPAVAALDVAPSLAVPVVFHAPAAPQARLERLSFVVTANHAKRVALVRHHARRVSEPRFDALFEPRRRAAATLVPVTFSYAYAAVPFGDGWLIVQL